MSRLILTAKPPITRNASEWPFTSESPFNMPIGDGAVFASDTNIAAEVGTINQTSWTVNVVLATNTDPLCHVTFSDGGSVDVRIPAGFDGSPPTGSDRKVTVFQPDGQGWDFHTFTRIDDTHATAFNGSGLATAHCITGPGHQSTIGSYTPGRWISGFSNAFGVMRESELAQIAAGTRSIINHCLIAGLPYTRLKKVTDGNKFSACKWPAAYVDNGFLQYNGTIYMGELLAIPPVSKGGPDVETLAIPEAAKVLARTLQRYGAYVGVQAGGGLTFYAELGSVTGPVTTMKANLGTIENLLRKITNNTSTNIGGGGSYPVDIWPAPIPVLLS